MPPSPNPLRTYILTGSVAAITATGAWYGAGLKTRQEFHQSKKQVMDLTPAEKISQLERTRARLVNERVGMEGKIEKLLTAESSASSASSSQSAGGGS